GPQAPQSQAAALGGGADAGLVEQVPGAVGAIRQELGKLPRPAATGLRPALVPTLASPVRPGGSEIVIKGAVRNKFQGFPILTPLPEGVERSTDDATARGPPVPVLPLPAGGAASRAGDACPDEPLAQPPRRAAASLVRRRRVAQGRPRRRHPAGADHRPARRYHPPRPGRA